ncbi:hypothetical protein ACOKFD_15610 [Flagellimonas sp. S174]|uniref:hypothetical protein n=1 Tax=Flagellimonas sp. S174 TaxID=3410790 RepID=UPI003BF49056
MGYREIDRSQPNDGNGDDARTWAGKTNENMKEVFSRNFVLNDTMVSRRSYDPLNLGFDEYRVDDEVKGWENIGTKTRWVEGIVLLGGFTWPTDIDDETKFFITKDRNR